MAKVRIGLGFNHQGLTRNGVGQGQAHGTQQQSMHAIGLGKEAVVYPFAVVGVANDRVAAGFEVPAQLMAPSGHWSQPHQSIAGMQVAPVHRHRHCGGVQPVIERHGRLGLAVTTLPAFTVGITRVQRVVNDAPQWWPAAHNGQIILTYAVFSECLSHPRGGVRIQTEQKNPGSGLVQPVCRVDMLTDLVAQQRHGNACFVAVYAGTVNKHAGGFVYCDQVAVLIQYGQLFRPFSRFSHPSLLNNVVGCPSEQVAS